MVTNLTLVLSDEFKLDELSFVLHEGEVVALIGPNGSGKTSLLKALLGLLAPDAGTVRLRGHDLAGVPVARRAHRIGYVPQHATSILHQETLASELAFTLRVQGKRGNVDGTLAELGVAHYRNQHPLDLSGGERQRAALAALAVAEPQVLLLDEPTRGLPASEKERLGGYLRRYANRGRTVLVVTHDAEFVARQADRVLRLDGGRLIADGPPAAVLPASQDYRTQINQLVGGAILTVDEMVAEIGAQPRKSAITALTPNRGA
jgi:energy-coupling factor transport system ATP-binding protein